MSQIWRSWLAFAALGAGILHLTLVPGSSLPVAFVLFPLGAAEFCWGLAVLARGTFVLAAIARGVALIPILLWAALLLLGGMLDTPELAASPAVLPMGVATLFDCVIAITLSIFLRREREAEATVHETNTWAYLGGLFAGGLVVSLLMTPALAFTQTRQNNPPATHGPAISSIDPGFAGHTGH